MIEADADPAGEAAGTSVTDLRLTSIQLGDSSPLLGQTLATADVRRRFNTHVVALQRGDTFIDRPASLPLLRGDRLWIVAPDRATVSLLEGTPA